MFIVIMAGGSGTRFWPASRKHLPKQFLNITGKDPMVVETCRRVRDLAGDEEIILVLGREHLKEIEKLFQKRKIHTIAEPMGRNTAPCIGLGALYAQYLGCQGPVAFLPADHFIAAPSALLESIRRAAKAAESGAIVTLGIVPTRPETGYGYIQWAEECTDHYGVPAYRVSAFVEKPHLEKARQYLSQGNFLWNAGIFVATPEVILKEIQACLPGLHQGLERLKKSMGTPAFENEIEAVYEDMEAISFDFGVMERTINPLLVVPCDCGWSDVGSWASLYALREGEYDPNQNLTEGDCLLIDCEKSFISSKGGRLVACLGMERILIVDTPDALLVADLDKSQDIRRITEHLRLAKKGDLL